MTEADIDDVPSFGASTLKPPPVVTTITELNWPLISGGDNFFDRALANGHLEAGVEAPYINGVDAAATTSASALDAWAKEEEGQDDIDPEAGGWELDVEGEEQPGPLPDETAGEEDQELGADATPGVSENELWIRNSPFAGDHVAAGSFDTAMQVCTISSDCRVLQSNS